MIKQIRKEDIPEWTFGDVAIKTFSFGDAMKLNDMSKGETEQANTEIAIFMVSAGIHFIRDEKNETIIIKNDSEINKKSDFIKNIDVASAIFLLKEIKELNKPLSDEEKKK